MRTALYARVSSLRQAQAQTIDQQLDRLKDYLRLHALDLLQENIFRDDGYSGASLNRPGLDRLRDKVRLGELDCIVVTSPDRLTRSFVHQALLIEEFERSGCRIEFLDRPVSQDPHDQLLLQIRGAVAEYERALISERMRRGRMSKYQAGLLLPWPRPPYGYRTDPDCPRDPSKVQIDEAEAVIIREIFAWYVDEGLSIHAIARRLQLSGIASPAGKLCWCSSTIRAILTNPVYRGEVYIGRTRCRPARARTIPLHPVGRRGLTAKAVEEQDWTFVAEVPAIIAPERFALVKERLQHNQQQARRNNTKYDYLLRRLVSCGKCGLACVGRAQNGRYSYYECRGKRDAITSRKERRCGSRLIPSAQLDELVWQDLCEILRQPEKIERAMQRAISGEWIPQELQARAEMLRKGQTSLGSQLERLTEAYLREVIPIEEYQRRRKDLEMKQEALRQQQQRLAAEVNRQKEMTHMVSSIKEFCERMEISLSAASFEQKRQLVELLIDRVVVTEDEVEIRYVIPTDKQGETTRFCNLRSDYLEAPSDDQHYRVAIFVCATEDGCLTQV